jgi:hypothetical protein
LIVGLQLAFIMDETKPHPCEKKAILPSSTHERRGHVSNVPSEARDIDFLMEHLNDPNYDLERNKKVHPSYFASDIDTGPHTGSDGHLTLRAEPKNSTAIDFDEYAFLFINLVLLNIFQ